LKALVPNGVLRPLQGLRTLLATKITHQSKINGVGSL
jgi:hypothetical protein